MPESVLDIPHLTQHGNSDKLNFEIYWSPRKNDSKKPGSSLEPSKCYPGVTKKSVWKQLSPID